MATKRGLTLGKYAPLHKGHQLTIETALSEMDEVVVIIYECPETTQVPLAVRAGWLRALYPSVRVIEAWNGPTDVGDTPEIRRRHEAYVIEGLKVSGITHFYSSEFYGDHMSRALGATNRTVDAQRATVPVSGTQIRSDPFAFRDYLDPRVFRDLIINVALLGAPSTGKTTLAQRLATQFATLWMPEYGREYWERHQVDRRLSPEQLADIAEGHLEREECLLRRANRYLFTDTNAITTYTFARYYHGCATSGLFRFAEQAASRYDLTFVCDIDIPYHDTWDRSGETNRAAFHRQVLGELLARKIPFFVLRGSLEDRVRDARRLLDAYRKYMNVLDLRDSR